MDLKIEDMSLHLKLWKISSEISYLKKDDNVGYGTNSYKAISSEKVITEVGQKLNKYGVVIYPINQTYVRTDEDIIDTKGNRKKNRISDVNVEYVVANVHKQDDIIKVVSSGCGVDTQDKGIGKAMTYAYKNMLLKLFNISTGDDTDKIHSDDYTDNLYKASIETDLVITGTKYIDKNKVNDLIELAAAKGLEEKSFEAALKKKYNCTIDTITSEIYAIMLNNLTNKGE